MWQFNLLTISFSFLQDYKIFKYIECFPSRPKVILRLEFVTLQNLHFPKLEHNVRGLPPILQDKHLTLKLQVVQVKLSLCVCVLTPSTWLHTVTSSREVR